MVPDCPPVICDDCGSLYNPDWKCRVCHLRDPISLDVLWISDYYDEPLEGLAKDSASGTYHRFEIAEESATDAVPDWSLYKVYCLSDSQALMWLKDKELFEKLVGTHWSYDTPSSERVAPVDSLAEYHEMSADLPDGNPVGRDYGIKFIDTNTIKLYRSDDVMLAIEIDI